jgi:hypothetical protein
LGIEIINSTSTPIIIKKNIKVTGIPLIGLAVGNIFGPKKTYELEIESRDSSCVTLPAWGCESYPASSKREPTEQLPLHLFLVKIFIGFHGKLRKSAAILYYLHEPIQNLSFWQYWKKRISFWWLSRNPNKNGDKIAKIIAGDYK